MSQTQTSHSTTACRTRQTAHACLAAVSVGAYVFSVNRLTASMQACPAPVPLLLRGQCCLLLDTAQAPGLPLTHLVPLAPSAPLPLALAVRITKYCAQDNIQAISDTRIVHRALDAHFVAYSPTLSRYIPVKKTQVRRVAGSWAALLGWRKQ